MKTWNVKLANGKTVFVAAFDEREAILTAMQQDKRRRPIEALCADNMTRSNRC